MSGIIDLLKLNPVIGTRSSGTQDAIPSGMQCHQLTLKVFFTTLPLTFSSWVGVPNLLRSPLVVDVV